MSISWTIDGVAVLMARDWSASVIANGGFDQFTGSFPAGEAPCEQGSMIRGYRTDGSVLWEGEAMASPKVKNGAAHVAAQGLKVVAEKYDRALGYRSDGAAGFVSMDSDPHGYGVNDGYTLDSTEVLLRWNIPKDTNILSGGASGFLAWSDGVPVHRFDFSWDTPLTGMSSFSLQPFRVDGASDPHGPKVFMGSDIDLNGSPGSQSFTHKDDFDIVGLQVQNTTAGPVQVAGTRKVQVKRLSRWGRLTDDEITASDIAKDVAALLQYDPRGITNTATDVMPVWDQGGTAADLLDYVCTLMDWRWLVLDGPRLDFGPWDRTWTGSVHRGIQDDDLTETERFDRVTVHYEGTSGEQLRATAYTDIGLVRHNTHHLDLSDPQPNRQLADAVAERALDWLSKPRVRGRAVVDEVQDERGIYTSGYAIRPGDRLAITDLPSHIGPQRVASVTYTSDHAEVELTQDINLARILRQLRKRKRRGR